MASINTNISALSSQNSMSDQIKKADQAIERLSSGKRINNAADDAAGSAIASKMEAQVRSLGVAIRNGHDAISMTQTAEGALGEMENILQRIRELAVQAGNSTLSASDRSAIQEEVDALTEEINNIADATNFNGVQLLDGSSGSVNFQVGVDASDSLSVDLESSRASDLGLSGKLGANVFTSGRVVLGATDGINTTAVKINGQNIFSAAIAATSGGVTAAQVIARGINDNTATHGAVATAFNRVEGQAMGDTFSMSAEFTITSGGTAESVAIMQSFDDVIDHINHQVADITATKGANNQLILTNTTGTSIALSGESQLVGILTGTYEGMYTVENVDGSATTIELGTIANGYAANDTDATAATLNMLGLNQTTGGSTQGTAVSTATLALTDDIRINGVQVGATTLDTAQAKADAINAISDQTGVTASASTIVDLSLDFNIAATDTSFLINGVAVELDGEDSVNEMVTVINNQSNGPFGVLASATDKGLLRLENTSGGDIKIKLQAVPTFVQSMTDGQGADISVPTATNTATIRGTIKLTSDDGGVIKLTDGTIANSGLAKLGLEGQSEEQGAGSGGVNVSSLGGAAAALESIDSAIEKVSSFRASFGAVENRIDAKINNLTTLKVNTQAAQSRIEDADFAAETTNMTKAQILSQAATSMLAQANASKQNLLALLQG